MILFHIIILMGLGNVHLYFCMKKVLIVEDDLVQSMIMERVVSSFGYKVCGNVETGAEAIEMASCLKPDIIISDYMLKGKQSGLDIIDTLRKRNLRSSFIIISGVTESDLIRDIESLECVEFLKKPFIAHELSAVLKKAANTRTCQNIDMH